MARSPAHLHLLYGLVIGSNLPVAGAPRSRARGPADISVEFARCDPNELRRGTTAVDPHVDRDPLYVLFRKGDGYLFDFPDGVQFAIDGSTATIHVNWPADLDADVASIYLVSTVLAFVLRLRGQEVLHASAVVIDGNAVAFIGPSGAGKSTLAACFARNGFEVLSEDVTALVDGGRSFHVVPSHSRVRLWPDAARTVCPDEQPLPFLDGEDWKHYLELPGDRDSLATRRYELSAIFILGARRSDGPRVDTLAPRDALLDLIGNTSHSVRDWRLAPASFERLGRIVDNVSLRLAVPGIDVGSVFPLADLIVNDARFIAASRR